MGLTLFYDIYFTFRLNSGIFCEILSVAENTIMDLNNVMDLRQFICGTCVETLSTSPKLGIRVMLGT